MPATAASGSQPALPEHCNVLGTVNAGRVGAQSSPGVTQTYAIKWQMRLPTTWNGRLLHEGGGGLDGAIPSTTGRLSAGYAIVGDDSGHDDTVNNDPKANGAAAYGTDYQARVDFAYNAIDQTNKVSQALVASYYGGTPQYAYFEGCSMGGREAMMVTQKLPDRFNGVVIGDPGFKLTAMSNHEVYDAQLLGALATSMGLQSTSGVPLISNTFTDSDLQLVSKAVLDACDAKDGLVDGMVSAPLQCTTAVVEPKLDALQCSGSKTATCLTAGPARCDQEDLCRPGDAERPDAVRRLDVGSGHCWLHERGRLQRPRCYEHRTGLAVLEAGRLRAQPGHCHEQLRARLSHRRRRRSEHDGRSHSVPCAFVDKHR